MAREFTVPLTTTPALLIAKARRLAVENDVAFDGDEQRGTFAGSGVEGHYTVAGDSVGIVLTRKPFYASWSMVEDRVREFFL